MPVLLQINSYRGSGSIGRIAEQIGNAANQHGWDVYVTSGVRYSKPSVHKEISFSSKFSEKLHGAASLLFDGHGRGSFLETRRLVKEIDRIRPDVVHIHNLHGYYLNYRVLFKYLRDMDIAVVMTLHDCWSFTGHCAHFVTAGCDRWKRGCHDCPLKGSYPKSLLFDRSRRNYADKKRSLTSLRKMTVVPVSHWLESLVRESYLNCYPVRVIQNGIDLDIYSPRKSSIRERFGIGTDKIILGVAGHWSESKGLREFADLSRIQGFSVILVGVQEDVRKKLPQEVICVGNTADQYQLAEFYSGADVFVNPTYADTFPTVNIEALACGTPVVTYRTGGSPEILDGNTGIVVECGDFPALVEAVRAICGESEAESMARSCLCRERAVSLFDKDERFMDYIRLYEEILEK